jgi:hypothetical protein
MNKKIKLCKASKIFGIKYSTAKTILRLYRNTNNIFIKNIDERRNLKNILKSQIQQSLSNISDTIVAVKKSDHSNTNKDFSTINLLNTKFEGIC